MIDTVFFLSLAILAGLLFFNFYAKKDVTRHVFGLFGGVWAFLIGVLVIVNGIQFHTGEIVDKDTTEFTNSQNETITNTTVNATLTFETQDTVGDFQYGDITGLFMVILAIFIFFGNLFGLMRS